MTKKRSSREFFERHREQFERTDQVFREWLERFEARRKAQRQAAKREAEQASESST